MSTSSSLSRCLVLRDFFRQVLRPCGTGDQASVCLCVDVSQHLLAGAVRVDYVLQINGESLLTKLRGCFHPDPVQLCDPRTGNPPFQLESDLAIAVLDR